MRHQNWLAHVVPSKNNDNIYYNYNYKYNNNNNNNNYYYYYYYYYYYKPGAWGAMWSWTHWPMTHQD